MKIAVITGASSGMGREFVLQIARETKLDEIWVIARRRERLEELQKEVEAPLRVLPLDLTQEDCILSYRALLEQEQPEVAVLCNVSGFGRFGAFRDIEYEAYDKMIDLNFKACVRMTYETLPFMKRGGQIYQLDSLSSFQPVPYINVYAATKAALLSFSRALNVELKKEGIRVMAVCPGWVKTEFFDHAVTDESVITYYNRLFTAEEVITRALRDMKKGKDVSVCGLSIRNQVRMTKLLPHRLVMKIWCRQQKK